MIEFTTPSGSRVEVEITRDRHARPALSITVQRTAGGALVFGGAEILDHAKHGKCLRLGGNTLVPVTAEIAASVAALIAECRAAAVTARTQAAAAGASYRSHAATVERVVAGSRL